MQVAVGGQLLTQQIIAFLQTLPFGPEPPLPGLLSPALRLAQQGPETACSRSRLADTLA